MAKEFQDKTALITGASRGIGRAITKRLSDGGARVLAHYGHSRPEAEALARETGAELVQADLADPEGPAQLAAAIVGPIDILVNNAGVASFVPWGEQEIDDFDPQFAINVRAPFMLTQALKDRISDDGRIIFLSSIVARRAFADGAIAAYAASKGAIDSLVVHLAPLFGARGITVNAVAPGAIATEMSGWLNQEGGPETAHAMQALKRVGQPEDIAEAVALLASDSARWITGQVVQAGGGTKL